MKKILILISILCLALAGIWYLKRPRPIVVELGIVETGSITASVVNTRAGTVKACRRARMAPNAGGQIAVMGVREGMRVQKGDLLLSLWNDDLMAAVRLAKQQVAESQANRQAICAQAATAKRQAQRLLRLLQSSVVTDEEVDRAVSERDSSAAQCQAAGARVKVATAQVAVAQANLARTRLYAPFAGIVAEVNGEVGEYLTPSPLGIQTLPAVDLVDTSCFYVAAPIDEVDAADIKVGMVARITMDAFPGQLFPGRVRRIADYVLDREKQARTVEIEVEFTNPAAIVGLLPGYSADTEIILQERHNTLRVPSEAVQEERFVMIFHPDTGRLEKRAVQTGLANWNFTEIQAGARQGEQVVLSLDRPGVVDGALATGAVPENQP